MTFDRFGSFPCSRRGRRMSHSMPFTPTTTTLGFGFAKLWFWAKTGAATIRIRARTRRDLRKPMGNLTLDRKIIHAAQSSTQQAVRWGPEFEQGKCSLFRPIGSVLTRYSHKRVYNLACCRIYFKAP